MSALSLGFAPRKPGQSQPWEQTNQDGAAEDGTLRLSCCWWYQTTGTESIGGTTACLVAVPFWPFLPSWAGNHKPCRSVFSAPYSPHHWLWRVNKTPRVENSWPEGLARGVDPHHGPLQCGTRDSGSHTPALNLGSRREGSI